MYFVALFNIALLDRSNIFGSNPPCSTTFFKFFFAQVGLMLGSMLRQLGLTNLLKSLYLSLIPLGKQMFGIFLLLQNFMISKFVLKHKSFKTCAFAIFGPNCLIAGFRIRFWGDLHT